MTEPDSTMAAIQEGLRLHLGGDRPGARAWFAGLWAEIGGDGDPLHRCALAHYMADVQDDPAEELEWDLRALRAADSLTGERAKEHHSSLSVRGFYPSLHLNLGETTGNSVTSAAPVVISDSPERGWTRSARTTTRRASAPGWTGSRNGSASP